MDMDLNKYTTVYMYICIYKHTSTINIKCNILSTDLC